MKEVIAMHGWGGDSNTWKKWSEQFRENQWIWKSVERGYGDLQPFRPNWGQSSSKNYPERRVVIAHSLGPHLIRSEVLEKATDVILLCSFSRFIPLGTESRYLKPALQGMKKQIGTPQEKAMLTNFLKKACQPESFITIPPGPIQTGLSLEGREKLLVDLELLIQTKGLPQGFPKHSKVLIVQGEEDAIVAPSAKSSLLNDLHKHLETEPTHWNLPHAGHLILQPGLIKRVRNWLVSNP